MNYRAYRVRIGDVEAPYEFLKEDRADAFARGARHVLDNLERHSTYQHTKVTVLTYQEVSDPTNLHEYHESVTNSTEY